MKTLPLEEVTLQPKSPSEIVFPEKDMIPPGTFHA
jgi:hypothetical protein